MMHGKRNQQWLGKYEAQSIFFNLCLTTARLFSLNRKKTCFNMSPTKKINTILVDKVVVSLQHYLGFKKKHNQQ